jgi:hypothetical protein
MRALHETEILTARALVEAQYHQALEAGKHHLALLSGLELLKTYVYAPTPELVAARGLLSQLVLLVDPCNSSDGQVATEVPDSLQGVTNDMKCDLARFRYHIEFCTAGCTRNEFLERRLRSETDGLGEVSRALVELTIARLVPNECDRQALEEAHQHFVHHGHLAAAAESSLVLASQSLSVEHHARAQRFFCAAQGLAEEGGSLYVSLSSLLGLFQTYIVSGALAEGRTVLQRLSTQLASELGLTAFGLPAVSALQVIGNYKMGEKLSRKCLASARSARNGSLEQEALFRLAGCLAGAGNWRSAADNYRSAALCAVKMRDFRGASEMLLSTLQAQLASFQVSQVSMASPTAAPAAEGLVSCAKDLALLENALGKVCVPREVVSLRARAEQVQAEILSLSGDSLGCVKRLGEARRLYANCDQLRNVALIDACSGVALLNVAKVQGRALWEEVFSLFQRALDLFEREGDIAVSWKIKYYLALAAALRSKGERDLQKQMMWAEVAHTWLEGAVRDHTVLASAQQGAAHPSWSSEFAPMLAAEALDALKRSLRRVAPKEQDTVAKRSGRGRTRTARHKGQFH